MSPERRRWRSNRPETPATPLRLMRDKCVPAPRGDLATFGAMLRFPQHVRTYLLIAFGFSFVLWFGAWLLASRLGVDVLLNNEIYFWDGNGQVLLVSLLFAIATLGPFIGAMVVRKQSHISLSAKGFKDVLLLFAFVLAVNAVATLAAWLFARDTFSSSDLGVGALIFALIYYVFTSGTEEYGWRGVLYPHIRDHAKSLWDSAFFTGLIWGVWHTPFVLYLFVQADVPLIGIVVNYAGFLMTIVLDAYLHGWINVRGGSTLANHLLHTLNNWMPVLLVFVFTVTPLAAPITIASTLLTVILLERFFPTKSYFQTRAKAKVDA